jgi:hypothetical protein
MGEKITTGIIWSVACASGMSMPGVICECFPGFMNSGFFGDEVKDFLIVSASCVPMVLGGSAVSYHYSDESLPAVVTTLLALSPAFLFYVPVIKYIVLVVLFLLGIIPAFVLRLISALCKGYGFKVGLMGPYYSLDSTDMYNTLLSGLALFSLLPGLIGSYCTRVFGYTTVIGTIKDAFGNTIGTIEE